MKVDFHHHGTDQAVTVAVAKLNRNVTEQQLGTKLRG